MDRVANLRKALGAVKALIESSEPVMKASIRDTSSAIQRGPSWNNVLCGTSQVQALSGHPTRMSRQHGPNAILSRGVDQARRVFAEVGDFRALSLADRLSRRLTALGADLNHRSALPPSDEAEDL